MRLKMKYVLPSVQMLLAVALLVWTYYWERALMRHADMPGTPPSFTLLISINAPLAIPRSLVFRYLPGWWDEITLILAIGMLWYWVALTIESWQQSRRVCIFAYLPLRVTGDVIALGLGGLLVCGILLGHRTLGFPPHSWADWLLSVPSLCLMILWAAVLIIFFGRDLVDCVLPRATAPKRHITGK
jgi:hypothetical protein